jgi:hypothetical protein
MSHKSDLNENINKWSEIINKDRENIGSILKSMEDNYIYFNQFITVLNDIGIDTYGKDFYEFMTMLSKKWTNSTDKNKYDISVLIGGIRNKDYFTNLVENLK